jgi:SAM-dependent methyltransferase
MNLVRFKEWLKNAIAWTGIFRTRAYIMYRMARGQENISHLLQEKRADRFYKIYENGVWLNGRDSGSLSGSGSEVENTSKIREELPKVLVQLEVKSLLDIGCGDWNWMQHVELPCKYIGVDLVPSVIQRNTIKFGSSSRKFMVLDAVEEPLPDCDAILSREVIFHLSFSDGLSLIKNVMQSHARYLFATSDPDKIINTDIRTGDFRFLNLERDPFRFPAPFMDILDDGLSKARRVCVWRLDDFRLGRFRYDRGKTK